MEVNLSRQDGTYKKSAMSSFCLHSMLACSRLLQVISEYEVCACREEYDLLDAVQVRLASYPLTAPVLGNIHSQFRGRGSPVSCLCNIVFCSWEIH
jgi:hypothetical protein